MNEVIEIVEKIRQKMDEIQEMIGNEQPVRQLTCDVQLLLNRINEELIS